MTELSAVCILISGTRAISSDVGDTLKTIPVLQVGFRTERFAHSIDESVTVPVPTCAYIHDRIAEFDGI